jgi:hypothetical protein
MGCDRRYHLRPEYGGNYDALGNASAYILPDKLEYKSPMDGSIISSRSTHREHMDRHNVMEAGDIPMGHTANSDRSPMSRVGHDIKRAIQELNR